MCVCVNACVCICVYVYAHVCACVHVCMCVHVCVCMHVCGCVDAHMHAYNVNLPVLPAGFPESWVRAEVFCWSGYTLSGWWPKH